MPVNLRTTNTVRSDQDIFYDPVQCRSFVYEPGTGDKLYLDLTGKPQKAPELKSNRLKTYIQGKFANSQSASLMANHPSGAFEIVREIHQADVVVWTGGEDIDPEIYNEKKLPCTYFDKTRDTFDLSAIRIAQNKGAIMIGLCRGAQLLNCVVGRGKLWQDVKGHEYGEHDCTDYVTSQKVRLNSLHHQMMIPGPEALVVCGTMIAKEKYGYESTWKRADALKADIASDMSKELIDPEVIWYRRPKALCIQAHPEFSHPETRDYFYSLVDRYILSERG